MLSYAFLRFPMLSCAFHMLSYPFIRFYMLLYASFGQSVRRTTTREAASLSNRLLPAEAGKNRHFNYLVLVSISDECTALASNTR